MALSFKNKDILFYYFYFVILSKLQLMEYFTQINSNILLFRPIVE